METPNYILLPTDFSTAAENALEFAANYARRSDCTVLLFHVSSLYLGGLRGQDEILSAIELEQIEEEQLAAWKIKAKRLYPDVSFEVRTSTGFPVELIRENAASHGVRLVVMGTKGAHGIGDRLLGSHTANLINKCSCPVLAVPQKARYTGFESIVFATDLSTEDHQAIEQLAALFNSGSASLTLLHIEDRFGVDAEADMDAWFHPISTALPANMKISKLIIRNEDVLQGLHSFLEENKTDLLVTSAHKRNFFERIFDKSVTRQLAQQEETPILALHAGHHVKSQVIF
jgi:nucleotide-binding universal stress UspA family protein